MRISRFALAAVLATVPVGMAAAQFTAGNLVIYQVGNGTGSLVNTGNVVILNEFTLGGALSGYSLTMPSTGSSPLLIASGMATSEGSLVLGNSGQTLGLTGYNRALGGSGSLTSTTGATVNRTIALVNGNGGASFTTLADFADGNNPRAAYTTNGTDIWAVGGAGGVRYTTDGAASSVQLTTGTGQSNFRSVQVVGGQLYVSAQSGTTRIAAVGTGTPTTGTQTAVNLPGITDTTVSSPYQFTLLRVGNPSFVGPNVLYFADDSADQIRKFVFDGTTWTASGSVAATDARGLTALVTGDNQVALFATTGGSGAAGGGTLWTVTDGSGSGTLTGSTTTLATAAANTAFRGVAFAPARLEWSGGTGTWDLGSPTTGSPNWTNTAPTTPVAGQKYYNAYAANFGNIAANATVTVEQGVHPQTVNVTNAANTYTFTNGANSNGIQGLAALNKSGAGTLVLAGSNTYSGGTFVTGGTLLANGPLAFNQVSQVSGSATGLGTVSVTAGTLGGTGEIAGAVTVIGAKLRGGDADGVGRLTINGGLTLGPGAQSEYRITNGSTPFDGVNLGSSTVPSRDATDPTSNNYVLVASGGLTADENDIPTMQFIVNGTGTSFVLGQPYSYTVGRVFETPGVPQNLSGVVLAGPLVQGLFVPVGFEGQDFSLIGDSNGYLYVGFTPVPEPATVLGLAAAGLGLGGLARRVARRKAPPVGAG